MTETSRYTALTERAYNYLVEHGGAASADTLARELLGGSRPGFFASILPLILKDSRFVQLPDGRWALAGWDAQTPFAGTALLQRPYLVVDVETTGLSPQRERVIELAVLLMEQGEIAARFCSLINPQRRIGSFISRYTGITNEMVQDEPAFVDILPELSKFIRAAGVTPVFVGHNTLFDAGFLRAEFERAGEPWLAALLLDTMRLGVRLVPGLRKPSLDRLAVALNIPVMNRHRAEGDARLTARAFRQLIDRAQEAGIATLEQLGEIGAVGRNRNEKPGTTGMPRARLIARPAPPALPEHPGIYMMKDAQGEVIYVGKARNLRRRVHSYYTQPLGYTRRMDGLMESLHTVETCLTGSELEALLLESRMIRRYRPRYNVQGRNWEDYLYIKLSIPKARKKQASEAEPNWPRISATRHAEGPYTFGPFRNSQAVRITIEVLAMLFPVHIRQYRRIAAGRAMQPVHTTPDHPKVTAEAVRKFLEGDAEGVLARLRDEQDQAVLQQKFEHARRLRIMLEHVERIVQGQRLISGAQTGRLLAIVQPSVETDCAELFITLGGLPLGQLRLATQQEPAGIGTMLRPFTARALQQVTAIPQEQLDELSIIARWLNANRENGPVLPLPGDGATEQEWDETVSRLLEIAQQQAQIGPESFARIEEVAESEQDEPDFE